MTKFDKLFYTGVLFIMTPIFLLIIVIICSSNSRLNSNGKIKKVVVVNAENNDWEDLTADDKGNLYIGDFGNNHNKRKNLSILKIKSKDLKNKNKVIIMIPFYLTKYGFFLFLA